MAGLCSCAGGSRLWHPGASHGGKLRVCRVPSGMGFVVGRMVAIQRDALTHSPPTLKLGVPIPRTSIPGAPIPPIPIISGQPWPALGPFWEQPPRLLTALFLAAVSSARLPICSGDGMFPLPPRPPSGPGLCAPLPALPPLGIAVHAWRAVAVLSGAERCLYFQLPTAPRARTCEPSERGGGGLGEGGEGEKGGCGPGPRSLPVGVFHRCCGKCRSRLVLLLSSSPSLRLTLRCSAASRCRESRIRPLCSQPPLLPGPRGMEGGHPMPTPLTWGSSAWPCTAPSSSAPTAASPPC